MIGVVGRNARTRRITSQPVDARQPEVEQHQVGRRDAAARDRLLAGRRRLHVVAVRLQRDADARRTAGSSSTTSIAAFTRLTRPPPCSGQLETNVAPPPGVVSTRIVAAVRLHEAARDREARGR